MHPVMTEMLAAERIREMVARGDAARCRGMPGKAGRSMVSGGGSGRL